MAQSNNKILLKRTTTAGRTPNTTNSGNTQYIAAGELALNLADGILYTSNGSALINLTGSGGSGVNTAAQYTFTNTIVFSNTITVANISANGTTGSAGQTLTSDGTKVYWSTPGGGGGSSVTISDTAPATPSAGDLWYYSVDAQLYIYYNDIDTSQWVSVTSGGGVISNANNALYLGGIAANQYAFSNSVVNVAAQFSWTNIHSFSNTIIFSSTINGTANNALYLGSLSATNYVNTTSIANYALLAGAAFTGNVSTSANLTVTGISAHTGAATFANTITVTGNATFSNIATFSSTITVTGAATFSNTISDAAGNIRSIPQNSQSATYELTANDNGKHISTTAGVTVNGATLSIGQTFAIYNNSASAITITQGSGATMYLAGSATTGNRTLAQRGLSTILMVASNTFVTSGSGLT